MGAYTDGLARYCLNAPTGAWCSLTAPLSIMLAVAKESQCTYRCVVLPDFE